MKATLLASMVTFALASTSHAHAQEVEYNRTDAMNVVFAFRGGVTLATPRGDFPSVIVSPSQRGTGAIGQAHGESGTGSRFELNAMIPIIEPIGIVLGIGTQTVVVNYAADSNRLATEFALQTLQAVVGAQWSIVNEASSYQYGGLRSVYVDAGLDIGVSELANRVESSQYADTVDGPPQPGVGSFTSSDAFRTVIAVRGAVGLRFAPTTKLEIIAETSYSYALNPLFSSDAIEDNDFAIDVLGAMIGIGYRF